MQIKVIASVAGVVTHNGMIYAPSKLKGAASRWTDTYPRPLIMHHDTDTRPVARAVSARYVDYAVEPPQKSRKDAVVIDHSNFTDATKEQRGMTELLKQPWVSDQRKNPGLGHLEVIFDVLDEDFERDVKRGVWVSGSMGFDTDALICPCCMKDWAKHEYCDHWPGEMYDGMLCAPMAGAIYPQEWSVCNVPAIEASKIIEMIDEDEDTEMKDISQMTAEELQPFLTHLKDTLGLVSREELEVEAAKAVQLREELRLADSKGASAVKDFQRDLLGKLGLTDSGAEELDLATAIKDHFAQEASPPTSRTPAPMPPFKIDTTGGATKVLQDRLKDAYTRGDYYAAEKIQQQISALAEEGQSK